MGYVACSDFDPSRTESGKAHETQAGQAVAAESTTGKRLLERESGSAVAEASRSNNRVGPGLHLFTDRYF
jgi:hypothetical protein